MTAGNDWTEEQRRQVLRLTHGYPAVVMVAGLTVALLFLWSGHATAASAASTATLAATGASRQGRLAAPAALRGVGIVSSSGDPRTGRP